MELKFIRDLLGQAKGVDGYVVMDLQGSVLTQDLGSYANRIKRSEFATWILNSFYAIDGFYPQAFCLVFRYASGHLYLTRTDGCLITVMCRHGADIHSIDNAFSKHRNAMTKSNTSGVVREKSKKGETVFLKISESGAGATSSPIPQKESGSATGKILGIIAGICLLAGGVAYAVLGGDKGSAKDFTPAPIVAKEVASEIKLKPVESPEAAQHTASTAALARDRSAALAKIAQQQNASELDAMDVARALAHSQNAQAEFDNKNYEAATTLWNQSSESYGKAAVSASEINFHAALKAAGLTDLQTYPTTKWISVEAALKEAKQMAQAGDYVEAVSKIGALEQQTPELKNELLKQLNKLAASAAKSNNVPAASELYLKVVNLDPSNQAARDYIYQNRYKPGETKTNSIGMTLAYIPAGKFQRGSPDNEAYRDIDETQSEVTITKGFFMSSTEVTQQQWEAVMGQKIRTTEPGFTGDSLPVHSIRWEQAVEFCRRLSEIEGKTYRLPTEAEWEYAARAGSITPYNNGKTRLTSREANIYDPSGEGLDTIAAVGSVGQANKWGLYDMHGNVSEWTSDWSAPYQTGPQIDPTGPDDANGRIDLAMKIVRGGSYMDDAFLTRSANRSEASPVVSNNYIGFRPVLILADL